MELIKQEVSAERFIPIPEPVRDAYRIYRPSPLVRALGLERSLDTPARIYYKYEAARRPARTSRTRPSRRPSTTARRASGGWSPRPGRASGGALSFAGALFGLETKVFMVKVSYEQKPYRRSFIQTMGASVTPSPSEETNAGRAILAEDPDSTGSLGIAISEALEVAATNEDTKYSLGSVLNHVLLHQTVIGQEVARQLEMAGETADVVIGCAGGGSNFAGIAFPLLRDRLNGSSRTRFLAVEPASCPSLTKGEYRYDFGDTAGMAPMVKMHTLGHQFRPAPSTPAGCATRHGAAGQPPLRAGLSRGAGLRPEPCFEAAVQFARTEGFIPAPESSHAIRAAIDEAIAARQDGDQRVIVFNLSGHGFFDMAAYDQFLAGELVDVEFEPQREAVAV